MKSGRIWGALAMSCDWPLVALEQLTDKIAMGPFGANIKVETFVPSGVPIISGAHLKRNKLEDLDFNFITHEHANKLKNSIVIRGDVVFTHAGTIGQVALIPESSKYKEYILSQRQFFARCNLKLLLPEFLMYYFKSSDGLSQLLTYANQTGVPSISRPVTSLKLIKIPLPSISEQRSIASILSSLDDKIELNNRINKTLEEIAQTLFKRWFVEFEFPDENGNPYKSSGGNMIESELGMIPEGWDIVSIKECIEDYIGGDWGKDSSIENYIAPVGCIRGADFPAIKSGTVSNLPLRYVKVSSLLRRRLVNEDIVLEISGGTKGRPVGRTVFINQALITKLDYPIIFSNFCRLIRCKKPYGLMVYQYIQMKYSDGEIEQYQLQSTGIANFQFNSFLDNFKIIMPNEQIAYLFSDIAGRLYERLQLNDSHILSQLRDTLLPKLMSGEIRVTDN